MTGGGEEGELPPLEFEADGLTVKPVTETIGADGIHTRVRTYRPINDPRLTPEQISATLAASAKDANASWETVPDYLRRIMQTIDSEMEKDNLPRMGTWVRQTPNGWEYISDPTNVNSAFMDAGSYIKRRFPDVFGVHRRSAEIWQRCFWALGAMEQPADPDWLWRCLIAVGELTKDTYWSLGFGPAIRAANNASKVLGKATSKAGETRTGNRQKRLTILRGLAYAPEVFPYWHELPDADKDSFLWKLACKYDAQLPVGEPKVFTKGEAYLKPRWYRGAWKSWLKDGRFPVE